MRQDGVDADMGKGQTGSSGRKQTDTQKHSNTEREPFLPPLLLTRAWLHSTHVQLRFPWPHPDPIYQLYPVPHLLPI